MTELENALGLKDYPHQQLVFLDTETTGLKEARLIEICFLGFLGSNNYNPASIRTERFLPPIEIEIGAMATHHITMEDLEGEKEFEGSTTKQYLKDNLFSPEKQNKIMVAHNAPFDAGILKNEGVEVKRTICTKKIAATLFPDLESHRLQYLRYHFKIRFDFPINPHATESDVIVLYEVFNRLLMEYNRIHHTSYVDTIKEMEEITKNPLLMSRIKLGKHKGRTFEDISINDPKYLQWMATQDSFDPDIVYSAKYWLQQTRVA